MQHTDTLNNGAAAFQLEWLHKQIMILQSDTEKNILLHGCIPLLVQKIIT
jgi:hypothetical protein